MSAIAIHRTVHGSFNMTRQSSTAIVCEKAIRSKTVVAMQAKFAKLVGGRYELVLPPCPKKIVSRVNAIRACIAKNFTHAHGEYDGETGLPELHRALLFFCNVPCISKSEIIVALLSLDCLLCGSAENIIAKINPTEECVNVYTMNVETSSWMKPVMMDPPSKVSSPKKQKKFAHQQSFDQVATLSNCVAAMQVSDDFSSDDEELSSPSSSTRQITPYQDLTGDDESSYY